MRSRKWWNDSISGFYYSGARPYGTYTHNQALMNFCDLLCQLMIGTAFDYEKH